MRIPTRDQLTEQERLIEHVARHVKTVLAMKDMDSKALAAELGIIPCNLKPLLYGRNMTLKLLSDVFLALGYTVEICLHTINDSTNRECKGGTGK